MGSNSSLSCIILTITLLFFSSSEAQLASNFYDTTCPNALTLINSAVTAAIDTEARMAASLIRLHFHDCFVQGCDGSVLLEGGERTAINNAGSIRGFEVIDAAKTQVESACPGIVSCADILAVAARDSSVAAGGPSWTVNLGRRDSLTASLALAQTDLPAFSASLDTLTALFSRKGLNQRDMVALSGAHTIGQAQCVTFRTRIYSNGTDIEPAFATTRQATCPNTGGNGNLAPLDLVTPNSFDNNYYSNLIARRGLLASDQVLFSGGATDTIVNEYSTDGTSFSSDFAAAMVKMGNIDPLTGTQGEIRAVCTAAN
ncbi:lignin-forming anionic peroxidase-like [Euphorbia lathyris]|uniref:lignin-forming anionic peroxidase-like n=1 Tax=Euphorbia lathyris TaxID=212925 RepID=UPI003313B8E5